MRLKAIQMGHTEKKYECDFIFEEPEDHTRLGEECGQQFNIFGS